MSETNKESWDGLLKNFLKAEHLKEQEEAFGCIGVNVNGQEMDLELQRGEEDFVFTLNVTNKVFLKEHGITAPKVVIGKKVTLKKVLAMNPTTRKEVDSLRICKLE